MLLGLLLAVLAHLTPLPAAILPPPWADPSLNPCAAQPSGWLLLYWPPDGNCYRIFQRGQPCPGSMELSPKPNSRDGMVAECRCPPGTAQNGTTGECHAIYTRGPCSRGDFFAPLQTSPSRNRRGRCMKQGKCASSEEVFWPAVGKCFLKYTRGPCPAGKLLIINPANQLAECQCSSTGVLSKFFWGPTKSCFQHFTKGPCLEKGALFLPNSQCGCHENLTNYHPETKQCYELGGLGPCEPGHRFELDLLAGHGTCVCKPGHVSWSDGRCYRRFTRGPCDQGEIVINSTHCVPIPCRRGTLYFPEQDSCYRVGVQGPCPRGQLVLFEQSVRPSIEGVSYQGMCGCSGPEPCGTDKTKQSTPPVEGRMNQQSVKSEREICEEGEDPEQDGCYLLYAQGPCAQGEWLVPARQGRRRGRSVGAGLQLYEEDRRAQGRCECKPGYTSRDKGCSLPLVSLAKFLNGQDYFR